MFKRKSAVSLVVLALSVSLSACATWDKMSSREKSTAIGAGVGGVAGAAVSGGDPLSTVGGAAVGGVIGNQVGKKR